MGKFLYFVPIIAYIAFIRYLGHVHLPHLVMVGIGFYPELAITIAFAGAAVSMAAGSGGRANVAVGAGAAFFAALLLYWLSFDFMRYVGRPFYIFYVFHAYVALIVWGIVSMAVFIARTNKDLPRLRALSCVLKYVLVSTFALFVLLMGMGDPVTALLCIGVTGSAVAGFTRFLQDIPARTGTSSASAEKQMLFFTGQIIVLCLALLAPAITFQVAQQRLERARATGIIFMHGTPQQIKGVIEASLDVNASLVGSPPLIWAAQSRNSGAVSMLLEAGVDVNARGTDGSTALIRATARHSDPHIVAMLLEAGADVNARDNRDATALTNAARNADSYLIGMLLEAGADVNAQDWRGHTALMIAVGWNQHLDVISLLLEAGANHRIRNKEGRMAVDFASEGDGRLKNTEIYHHLIDITYINEQTRADFISARAFDLLCANATPEQIKAILERVTNFIMLNRGLSAAARRNSPEVVLALLEAGADVTVRVEGRTALMDAIIFNRSPEVIKVISMLIEAGSDVNADNGIGWTPLMSAVDRGRDPEIIFALLDAGADVSLRDFNGRRVTDLPGWRKEFDEHLQRRNIDD